MLLADLDPNHFISQNKRVISKLKAYNEFAYPVVAVQNNEHLELSDEEYSKALESWTRWLESQASASIQKHMAGKHDQSSHAGGKGSSKVALDLPDDDDISIHNLVSAKAPYVGLTDKAQSIAARIKANDDLVTKVIESPEDNRTTTIISRTATFSNEDYPDDVYTLEYRQILIQQAGATQTFSQEVIAQATYDEKADWHVGEFYTNTLGAGGVGDSHLKGYSMIQHIEVDAKHTGLGLATAMLEFARSQSPEPIFHSSNLSQQGREFARTSKGLAKHLAGKHDQSTHGRGGLHGSIARNAFWLTSEKKKYSAAELKDSVARNTLDRMHKLGISNEDIVMTEIREEMFGQHPNYSMKTIETLSQSRLANYKNQHPDYIDKLALDHVGRMTHAWAISSNESSKSVLMQERAKTVFGLDNTTTEKVGHFMMRDYADQYAPNDPLTLKVYDGFLQAQYDETQDFFKSKGITEITLYRGSGQSVSDFGLNPDDKVIHRVMASQRPLSSWSTNLPTALSFASDSIKTKFGELKEHSPKAVIYRQIVPVSKVFSTPFSGLGCYKEQEVVCLGGTSEVDMIRMGDVWTLYDKDYGKRN